MLSHLRLRPSLPIGLCAGLLAGAIAALFQDPITALLIGWDCAVLAYGVTFFIVISRITTERLAAVADTLDENRFGILAITVGAAIASLFAIVAELAHVHGAPHAGWTGALAGVTVLLSWFFVHTVFATHYAHAYWRDATGLSFPGNDKPNYGEFLYFSFCMAVAFQVSDVSTQSAGMRQLVLGHSIVSYLFNTAIIAAGVNIAASLAS